MRVRDLLLVGLILGLVASAALLSWRAENPGAIAVLLLLSFSGTLVIWGVWLVHAFRPDRLRILLLNGAAGLLAGTLWMQFVIAEWLEIGAPLSWWIAIALAWMISPFAALILTSIGRRLVP